MSILTKLLMFGKKVILSKIVHVLILLAFLANTLSQISDASILRLFALLIFTVGFGKTISYAVFGTSNQIQLNSGFYFVVGSVSIAITWVYVVKVPALIVLILMISLFGLFKMCREEFSTKTLSGFRDRFTSWSRSELSLPLSLFIGVAWTWQRWNPINSTELWKYQTDVMHIEALSRSFLVNGFDHTLLSPEDDLRYHWISYSFAGFLADNAALPAFYAINWILPLIVYLVISRLIDLFDLDLESRNFTTKSVVLVCLILGIGFEIPTWLPLMAFSTYFALPILFCIIYLICIVLRESYHSSRYFVVISFLTFALVGSKGSTAVVTVLAFLVVCILNLLPSKLRLRESRVVDKKWLVLICVTLIFSLSLGWYVFFSGEIRSRPIEIGLSLNAASLIPACLMVFYGLCDTSLRNFNSRLAFSFFVVGSLLSLLTRHPSGNELWFLFASMPACLVLAFSRSKFDSIFHVLSQPPKLILSISLSIATAGLWMSFENYDAVNSRIARSAIEMFIPVLAFSFMALNKSRVFVSIRMFRQESNWTTILITSLLLTSLFNTLESFRTGPIYANSKGIYGYGPSRDAFDATVSSYDFQAAEWVRENTAQDVLFVSNRFCVNALDSFPGCHDIWATASALTQRNFLIDGGGYVAKTYGSTRDPSRLENLVMEVFNSPNEKELTTLVSMGVDFVWLDKRSFFSPEIYDFSSIVFSAGYLEVLKLSHR